MGALLRPRRLLRLPRRYDTDEHSREVPIRQREDLLAALYRSPRCVWFEPSLPGTFCGALVSLYGQTRAYICRIPFLIINEWSAERDVAEAYLANPDHWLPASASEAAYIQAHVASSPAP